MRFLTFYMCIYPFYFLIHEQDCRALDSVPYSTTFRNSLFIGVQELWVILLVSQTLLGCTYMYISCIVYIYFVRWEKLTCLPFTEMFAHEHYITHLNKYRCIYFSMWISRRLCLPGIHLDNWSILFPLVYNSFLSEPIFFPTYPSPHFSLETTCQVWTVFSYPSTSLTSETIL